MKLSYQTFHLVLKWLAIVVLSFRTDIAAGGKHVPVLAYVIERSTPAETGDIDVVANVCFAAPSILG